MTNVRNKYEFLKEFKNHEKIIELNDKVSGLQGFIAIHNTALGPALGGTRVFPYKNKLSALKDVLKLSSSMTNKSSIAGLKFGGGKGVIIADPKQKNIKKILKAYTKEISKLKGHFYTGEDVGLTEANVQFMLKFCEYLIGKSHLAGDPSPYASLSAFLCIKTALKKIFSSEKIKGRVFAIKGVGKTGSELARLLYEAGGKVIIADINPKKVEVMLKKFPNMKAVKVYQIQNQLCDVYAPCAMGNDINPNIAKKIHSKIICGTANNQLTSEEVAETLFKRGIIHVPDYIANAGGLINVSAELWPGGYSKDKVLKLIKNLQKILDQILNESKKTGINPDILADTMSKKNLLKHSQKLNA